MSTTVAKALRILALFESRPDVGVTEAGEQLSLSKSNASRLLSTLEDEGWVNMDPTSRRYRLGGRVLRLAANYYHQLDLGRFALPTLEWLRDQTGETAVLQIRMGDHRVCIEQVPSRHAVRRVVHVGEPYELNAGSSGKILLAFMPEPEREELLDRLPTAHLTEHSPSLQVLRHELVEVRDQGFAVSVDERVIGNCGVAAPVFDYRGANIAAVGVSGPTSRVGPAEREKFAGFVVEAARRVSDNLGSSGPQ